MPMHYPPLADGTYRYGSDPQPLPSPVPGPDAAGTHAASQHAAGQHAAGPNPDSPAHTDPSASPPPPSPGTPDEADSDSQRPRGTVAAASIVGGLGLVVVMTLGLVFFGPGSGRGPVGLPGSSSEPRQIPGPAPDRAHGAPFTVEGRFTVVSSPGAQVSGDGESCELPPTLSDIGEGTRITLVEDSTTVLGTAQLVYDEGDLTSCTFTFGFTDVPSGGAMYVIQLAGRGQLIYTEDELRAGIEITLGR